MEKKTTIHLRVEILPVLVRVQDERALLSEAESSMDPCVCKGLKLRTQKKINVTSATCGTQIEYIR